MTAVNNISDVNLLLNDKLFQVIGSTPASIAESLKKVDIKGKKREGAQMFAVSIFASAVNKPTLETFVADTRFADVRPLIIAALSIQGKSNMTALTLLGHCFLATDAANEVQFAVEFRKKMGQSSLWTGELEAGSLSDVQKKILKEKKRVTVEREAKALGNGFLKHTGLMAGPLQDLEITYFGTGVDSSNVAGQASSGSSQVPSGSHASGVNSRQTGNTPSPPRADRRQSAQPGSTMIQITNADGATASVPSDVLVYRRSVLQQSDADIFESLQRRGYENFVSSTRQLAAEDPTGARVRGQSTVG